MNKAEKIQKLVATLDKAAEEYYSGSTPSMSDFEYDRLYDELSLLENETGLILSNSPTQKVGYEAVSSLVKVAHKTPMLSLDKTKDTGVLEEFLGEQNGLLSWKLDGLTVVLTYKDGELYQALTRGNGQIGENITHNARFFKNIPLRTAHKGEFTVRGEAVISYKDFEKINEKEEIPYKNPRNLCSGTVRQLSGENLKKRGVHCFIFGFSGDFDYTEKSQIFEYLEELGFQTVFSKKVNKSNLKEVFTYFEQNVKNNEFASDGLVLTYDDIAYSKSLGTTSKFPKDALAFKWRDETAKTTLEKVEWSASRTGLINPIAVFAPVELEGTTVERASLHNISILEQLKLGLGDTLVVYKANMIIPQIAENLTQSGTLRIPAECPACGGTLETKEENTAKFLYCVNPHCRAKTEEALSHFVSRDALNIEGLSIERLRDFVEKGFIADCPDIFELKNHRDEIVQLKGYGKKLFDNLTNAIENSKTVKLPNFIYSLGIMQVGLSNAKLLCKYFGGDIEKIKLAEKEDLLQIEGFGEVLAESVYAFFKNPKTLELAERIYAYLRVVKEERQENAGLSGKTFVITGSLEQFENRKALQTLIEDNGGRVSGSVSAKTDYLINNDNTSSSAKNKKARELGIKIITETEFINGGQNGLF
ncbi:DNA ligase [Clostridia bacterium]|nr:DNA ligase [Clostridia bacterium]